MYRLMPLLVLFVAAGIWAGGIGADLNHFFDELGGQTTNGTSPHAYQGQRAGYYTGGTVFSRNPVRNTQIAQVELPGYRAGCGGIDLWSGSFSYINRDELVNALKGVINSAKGYAFMLGMETMTPMISNTMKYIRNAQRFINKMNVNSCEAAVQAVGSVWPKTKRAHQQICQDLGTQNGAFSDWAAARQGCGHDNQTGAMLDRGAEQSGYRNMIFHKGNLAWRALQRNAFLQQDPDLAELFMSLSGSIILNPQKHQVKKTVLPSLIHNQGVLKALMQGGRATLYRCQDRHSSQCLHVEAKPTRIERSAGLENRVARLLHQMARKVQQDQPLNQQEKGLLQITRLPVYKMLNVQAAWTGPAALDVSRYADIIATDLLYQYLEESLEIVNRSAAALELPEAQMQPFQNGIDRARQAVAQLRHQTYEHLNAVLQLMQRTQMIETQLNSQLSSRISQSLQYVNQHGGGDEH